MRRFIDQSQNWSLTILLCSLFQISKLSSSSARLPRERVFNSCRLCFHDGDLCLKGYNFSWLNYLCTFHERTLIRSQLWEHRIGAEGEIALVFFSGDMLTCALRVKRYNFFLSSSFRRSCTSAFTLNWIIYYHMDKILNFSYYL